MSVIFARRDLEVEREACTTASVASLLSSDIRNLVPCAAALRKSRHGRQAAPATLAHVSATVFVITIFYIIII